MTLIVWKNPSFSYSIVCVFLWASPFHCVFLLDYSWRHSTGCSSNSVSTILDYWLSSRLRETESGLCLPSRLTVYIFFFFFFFFFREKEKEKQGAERWKQKRSNMSISQKGHWCPRRKMDPFTKKRPSAAAAATIAQKKWSIAVGRATCFPVWDWSSIV